MQAAVDRLTGTAAAAPLPMAPAAERSSTASKYAELHRDMALWAVALEVARREDRHDANACIKKATTILTEAFPQAEVALFGSRAANLQVPSLPPFQCVHRREAASVSQRFTAVGSREGFGAAEGRRGQHRAAESVAPERATGCKGLYSPFVVPALHLKVARLAAHQHRLRAQRCIPEWTGQY